METETIIRLAESNGEVCKVCRYADDCDGGVRGGPNGPIYPPCADAGDDCFDAGLCKRYFQRLAREECWKPEMYDAAAGGDAK